MSTTIKNEHKKTITMDETLGLYASYLFRMGPMLVPLSLILAIPIGYLVKDIIIYGIAAVVIWIFLPIFAVWLRKRKTRKWQSKAYTSIINTTHDIDYFNYTPAGGVAIDLNNKSIAALNFNVSKEPIIFPFDSVMSYQAWGPGLELEEATLVSTARDFGDLMLNQHAEQQLHAEVEARNVRRRQQMASQTGLYFNLDDLNNPSYLVPMPIDEAHNWTHALSKIYDGSLIKPGNVTLYPK